jgi:hypothetical protein
MNSEDVQALNDKFSKLNLGDKLTISSAGAGIG